MNDKLSKYNILVSTFSFLLTLISNVILRSYLLNSVGSDYFAVNVILTNAVNIFSIFELGLGVTAVYMLYKPISENDNVKVATLYFYFKKLYLYVSLFTAVMSIPLVYFVYNFVSEVIDFLVFSTLYFLYVFNLVIVLNCSINKWYLYSKQKIYSFCIIEIVTKILLFSSQLAFLLNVDALSNKYLLFVIMIPLSSLALYLLLNKYMKEDELLMSNSRIGVDLSTKDFIFKKLKGGVNHKIGDVFMNYSDYFIISTFISLSVVTNVSNYLFMTASIVMLITKIFEGLSAKIGHLIASNDTHGKQKMFSITYISSLFLAIASSLWIYQCSGAFISLWLGSEYLIEADTLALIVVAMFLQIMRVSSNMMKQAGGVIDVDKHIPIIESILSFSCSIVLTMIYGINGIFIAKIVTGLLLSNWVKPFYIFKYILHANFSGYIHLYIKSLLASVLVLSLFYLGLKEISLDISNWYRLFVVSFVYSVIVILSFTLLFYISRKCK